MTEYLFTNHFNKLLKIKDKSTLKDTENEEIMTNEDGDVKMVGGRTNKQSLWWRSLFCFTQYCSNP